VEPNGQRNADALDPAVKVAYVCYRDAFSPDGVVKKINSQIGHWRSAGHEVHVFCLSPRPIDGRTLELDAQVFTFASMRTRIGAMRELIRTVHRFNPDLVYLRYDFYLPTPRTLLRRFANAVEINTDDQAEWGIRSLRAAMYLRPNRRAIFGHADGFVCVTHQLASSAAIASHQKPTVVISNGYDVAATRSLPPTTNARPKVVFIGHPGLSWHGLDKIAWLAGELPEMDFALIGPTELRLNGVPPNVVCHGFMDRQAYEPILASSDVALGTLALHRKGMTEACPLKVREYLLYGLPTIVAYDDTDFLGERPWFLLQLPNSEDNVRTHVADIRAFIEQVRGRRVARAEVEHRLSSEAKEVERLAFLEHLKRARQLGGRR
jgi:LmbE family N-acetylglucosaminyl deacetylase